MRTSYIMIFLLLFSIFLTAQETEIVTDDETGEPMIIGQCTSTELSESYTWWMEEYDSYKLLSDTLDQLSSKIDSIDITVIMGTWCSDSHMHVPRLFSILDYLGYPGEKVNMICVHRDKTKRGSNLEQYKIEFIPTIIFYKNGIELGRISEAPKKSLEVDLFDILNPEVN